MIANVASSCGNPRKKRRPRIAGPSLETGALPIGLRTWNCCGWKLQNPQRQMVGLSETPEAPVRRLEEEAFQRACATHVAEARERLLLDLPHPLPRDAEQRADLLERHGLLALEPEVEAQDSRLPLLERPEIGRAH